MPDEKTTAPLGIDPRGPRFAAGITSVLLLIVVFLGLTGLSTARLNGAVFGLFGEVDFAFVGGQTPWLIAYASPLQRLLDPAFLLLLVTALLFLWGVLSPRTAPWGVVYRRLVAPRLAPPTELEDPQPRASRRVWACSSWASDSCSTSPAFRGPW